MVIARGAETCIQKGSRDLDDWLFGSFGGYWMLRDFEGKAGVLGLGDFIAQRGGLKPVRIRGEYAPSPGIQAMRTTMLP